MSATVNNIRNLIKDIKDPEIPVLTIDDLGIIREIRVSDDFTEIDITPTYSGCPAMKQIENEITTTLRENGVKNIKIKTVYSPAWTTDWIPEKAKERLRAYGIAPPLQKQSRSCPRCHSSNTEMISAFSSTACKALYRCLDCKEPFDYFKCH